MNKRIAVSMLAGGVPFVLYGASMYINPQWIGCFVFGALIGGLVYAWPGWFMK